MQPSGVALLTSATLPAEALIAIGVESVTSGVGKGAPTAAVVACCTSRYWPGCRLMLGSSVICVAEAPKLPVPVALAYWIDQPLRLTD